MIVLNNCSEIKSNSEKKGGGNDLYEVKNGGKSMPKRGGNNIFFHTRNRFP